MEVLRWAVVSIFPSSIVSRKLRGSGCGRNMVHSVVEAEPVRRKPPTGVDVHIFKGGRRGFGAPAPSPTRASSLLIVRAGGSVKSSSP